MKPGALRSFEVPGQGKVSVLVEIPLEAIALVVLAHGAGAGMTHPSMKVLAESLQSVGIGTFRYQFPYMERGSKRPDSPSVAVAAVEAAVRAAAETAPDLPLFAGGKSFGGRMTTTAAALGKLSLARGLVCFAFPLHPAKKPGVDRAQHLENVKLPTLWIQGTRDDLADLSLVRRVVKKHRAWLSLQVLPEADHAYHVRKSSGIDPASVWTQVGDSTLQWVKGLI